MDHSCQFNFRQIQKSNISAFQSPGDNFDFLPTFDFSMPGDLSLCQSYTLSTQTSTPTIASINQLRVFSLKRVHISASQLLYSWLKGMFFSAVPPLCWPRRDWLDWPAETFNRYNCVWVCSSQPSSILWLRSSIFPCLSICLTVPPSRIGDLTSYVHY